jgi:hypothetical protein
MPSGFEILGAREFVTKLQKFERAIDAERVLLVKRGVTEIQKNARTEQLAHQSGPPLANKLTMRHGQGLSGSIRTGVGTEGGWTVGRVGVSQNSTAAKYAKMHETGEPAIIIPRAKKWLRFKTLDGFWHTVKSVRVHARPYLKPAYEACKARIQKDWEQMPTAVAKRVGL